MYSPPTVERHEYDEWPRNRLIERVEELESELRKRCHDTNVTDIPSTVSTVPVGGEKGEGLGGWREKRGGGGRREPGPQTKRQRKAQRADRRWHSSTRYIALKLAYLGQDYSGFEYSDAAALPTIEQELWRALVRTNLIPSSPDDRLHGDGFDLNGCDYSKCGRTDRGVSAFGQVIGLRVRSKRPWAVAADDNDDTTTAAAFDSIRDELPYCRMLNHQLPPDVRVLAWCPSPPAGFSARFSCQERQYRYFFTQPASAPSPLELCDGQDQESLPAGWLDVEAMQVAARLFVGTHDFRNFCKFDPSKLLTNYVRTVFDAQIEEVPDAEPAVRQLASQHQPRPPHDPDADRDDGHTARRPPTVYSFHVSGSAFLWHQIRHMVAVLFMVGRRLEAPSIVSELLDVDRRPRRPGYQMAAAEPLVLWDCIYAADGQRASLRDGAAPAPVQDGLAWIYVGDEQVRDKHHPGDGLFDGLWELWHDAAMQALLRAQLLGVVAGHGDLSRQLRGPSSVVPQKIVYNGNGRAIPVGKVYQPLLQRTDLRPDPLEAVEAFARKNGFATAAEMKAARATDPAAVEIKRVDGED